MLRKKGHKTLREEIEALRGEKKKPINRSVFYIFVFLLLLLVIMCFPGYIVFIEGTICLSYVDEVLRFFRSQDHFSAFYNEDLKNYALFKKILNDFRAFYGLNQFDLKQIDQYLWQLGKEYFKKDFGKK